MKRLLCIVGSLDQGGAETFLMKMYRRLDRTQYQMDFCVMNSQKGEYEDEIIALGGRIYHIVEKSSGPMKCLRSIKSIVKENGYKSVIRVNEHSLSVLDLIAAKSGGAEILAMRSSNANSGSSKKRLLHRLFKFLPVMVPNVKIAPSDKAAEYTFGKKAVRNNEIVFLRNGIPYNEYDFSMEKREKYKNEFKLDNCFVIGHIGRFSAQKNHIFLIGVFKELMKMNVNARLLLIGDGELRDEIKKKTEEYGIRDKVIFAGKRSDVPAILSVMDMLLFPSLYEGMPNVVIEAQAAGLPCVISDTITREADITGLVRYLPLENGAEAWAECCAETLKEKKERQDTECYFKENKYDIESVTDEFIRMVF